jgi:hypothetical protein
MIVGGCVRLFTRTEQFASTRTFIVKLYLSPLEQPNKAVEEKKVVRSQIKIKAANESLSVSHHHREKKGVG